MDKSPYCCIRAKCKPSMKDTVQVSDGKPARHYSLHVMLVKKTGKIECGQCNCKPGATGLCSHVGALLIAIVDVKNACTSKICDWIKPQTALVLKPHRLKDIQISVQKEAPLKPYPDVYQAGPCKDPGMFFKDIMSKLGEVNPDCVLYKSLNLNISNLTEVMQKYEPPFAYHDSVDISSVVCQSQFRTHTMALQLDETDIVKIRESTRGQSLNPLWKDMRTHILTASKFGSVCKKKPETEPDTLISKLRGYNAEINTKAVSYGRKKESQARLDYAKQHMDKCGKGNVQTTGLVISKEFPFLGASVDGIINCDRCGAGVLEVKCPYTGRHSTPDEWSTSKSSFVDRDENGKLRLKDNHNYMYQVVGQMKVLDVKWCDFMIWTKKGVHIERIFFDSEFWMDRMLFKLKFFYNSFFVAELFTNRVKRGKKLMY